MHFISAGFYHNIFSRCKELSDWRKPHTKRNFRRQTAQLEIYSRGLLVYLKYIFDKKIIIWFVSWTLQFEWKVICCPSF